jgi:hypothetical protein
MTPYLEQALQQQEPKADKWKDMPFFNRYTPMLGKQISKVVQLSNLYKKTGGSNKSVLQLMPETPIAPIGAEVLWKNGNYAK